MKQAFIIMPIGDSELDEVYHKHFVPALEACGFAVKRIDEHNEGRLLTSEIARFIVSSEVVIADLTNERPNCYLEVGYAMGTGGFPNLILTARRNTKNHFDLSGYHVLFWDDSNLDEFKDRLANEVNRRLRGFPIPKELSKHLADLGIEPYEEVRSFLEEAGVSSSFIAIDGVVCLAPMPNWGSRVEDTSIEFVDVGYPPPKESGVVIDLSTEVPRGDEDRGKWYIQSYSGVIEDRWSGQPHFDLGPSDYSTNLGLERAWTNPTSSHYRGETMSMRDLYRLRRLDFRYDLWHMITLQITVVTQDRYLLLFQRSQHVRYFKGYWSASLEEHMQRQMNRQEPRQTDQNFVECIKRALDEELGLQKSEINDADIVVTALARAAINEDMNTHILAFVQLPMSTYEMVDKSRMTSRSGGEHLDIDRIPFNPDSVAKTLLGGQRYVPNHRGSEPNYFQPSSRMRILFSAFRYFGIEPTLEALRKHKKSTNIYAGPSA